MIKGILITNFQSHENTELDFHEGVNIIVGTSDSGKSAIIRALRWLVWNRPSGEAFRSHWGGPTKVIVDTDDAIVSRLRDKENKYVLGDTHFNAIRTDVPEEIQKALNMTELNLQTQLEMPFLLAMSPGEVASYFNDIAGLSKIDTSLQYINRSISQFQNTLKFKESEKEKKEESLKSFEHLEKFEAGVEAAETLHSDFLAVIVSKNKLSGLMEDIVENSESIESISQILSLEDKTNSVFSLIEKRDDLQNEIDRIESLIKRINDTAKDIEDQKVILSCENTVNTLLELTKTKKKHVEVRRTLSKALSDLDRVSTQLKRESARIVTLEAEFKANMPEICPLCGNKIKS